MRKRQEKVSEEVKEIAWKAQQRLHQRYRKLLAKGKNKGVIPYQGYTPCFEGSVQCDCGAPI